MTPKRSQNIKGKLGTSGSIMRYFFGSTASLTIIILALIVVFLFREGSGFFNGYSKSLEHYRNSGLEYVDIQQSKYADYTQLQNELFEIRADWIKQLQSNEISQSDILDVLTNPSASQPFQTYREIGDELNTHLNLQINGIVDNSQQADGAQAGAVAEWQKKALDTHKSILTEMTQRMQVTSTDIANIETGYRDLDARLDRFETRNANFADSLEAHYVKLEQWRPDAEVSRIESLLAFITGQHWITGSDQQDWYGLLPLLSGSLLVSGIALLIAVPLAVGAAVYVNQIAKPIERTLIKPYIEFISALPSVVIGFFGVMVFGELLRALTQWEIFALLPFFPIEERLNAFCAGCLLALMAIPTIFTLTEDALNNVPSALKEASAAVGATRLQTIIRVILPGAANGIISAIMLGFGRVIGETMIVLLCAGNRIKIPSFDISGEFLFEPVHSVTGLIAQEMGEVVYGSLHYRALFIVAIVLFLVSLICNYAAQVIAKRYTHPVH